MPYLQIDDIQLHYEVHGEGEPLLFIHGLGGSLRDWDGQLEYFAQHYRVLLVDVRGHGDSDKPRGPYSLRRFAADISALLHALKLESVHVCGISMGGMIAFQLAADAPQQVRSLTIVNAGPAVVVNSFQVRRMLWQRALLLRLFSMRKLAEAIAGKLLPRPELADVRRAFVERMSRNRKREYRASFRAIVGWSVLDRLADMRMPALIVSGDLDYSSPAQKEPFVKLMPNARMVVLEDARHALPVEWPERFNAVLAGFLAEVERERLPQRADA